jgi:DNA mismatch repair protein MSH4
LKKLNFLNAYSNFLNNSSSSSSGNTNNHQNNINNIPANNFRVNLKNYQYRHNNQVSDKKENNSFPITDNRQVNRQHNPHNPALLTSERENYFLQNSNIISDSDKDSSALTKNSFINTTNLLKNFNRKNFDTNIQKNPRIGNSSELNSSSRSSDISLNTTNLIKIQTSEKRNDLTNQNTHLVSTIGREKQKSSSTAGRKFRFNNSTALKGSAYVEQEWAVSIIENYAREVGISAFNFRTMELYITQFIDNEAYVNSITMINFWRPIELIMNQKAEDSCLHQLVKKIFRNSYVGFLPRKNFAEDQGKEIYLQSGFKELTSEELNTKYVCMASLAGLISHLDQNSQVKIEKEHLVIKFYYLENHLNISFQSTIDLELLLNLKFNKTFGSLFSIFNCQTVSGHRLLRSNILQPLAVKEDLVKRYQAVEELCNNPEIMLFIKETLPHFKDLEIHISKFMHKLEEPTENIIKGILSSIQGIRICLKTLKNFREVLKFKLKSELFTIILNSFEDKIFDYLLENIENLIEEFDFTNTKITRKQDSIFFMIKAGINNVLDVSRKTYSDTVSEIYSEYEKLKISTNDPNIKLLYSESRGYYLILNEKYFIESDYVVSRKVGKKFHCANIPLVSLSERIKEIKRDLVDISMNLISDLVHIIQKNVNYLYVFSSYVALLDVICAFAEYSKLNVKVVKPIINNGNINNSQMRRNLNPFIFGKNCRHPLYEKTYSTIANHHSNTCVSNFFVPNDYLLTSHFNILLLKGANASGKTTYMKGLALLTILAQIGCFVPCDYFEFSLRKFLYTKFDSNDNVEENRGTYIKEIIEIQKVITNHLNDSLILLDEPFDNSDSKENLALSMAVLDQFTNKFTKSFVIISSHNNSLTQLGLFYFNIVIGTMVVEFTDEAMNFLFKFRFNNPIKKGEHSYESEQPTMNNIINFNLSQENSYNEENYGIILANMIGLNKDIISSAKEISYKCRKGGNKIKDYIEYSPHVTIFKTFLFKLLMEMYELKFISNCFVIEEEVIMKKREITQFIQGGLN